MLPLWDDVPRRRTAVTTTLLIAANLAVFAYQIFLASNDERAVVGFMKAYALVPRRLLSHLDRAPEWGTVFTAMFLHGGVAHVLGNCWFLWIFGKSVEDRYGSLKFLIFYLVSGLGAAALQVAVSPSSALPMLGASGAISGVMGAYFVLFRGAWVYTLVPWIMPIIPVPAFLFLLVWFAMQAFNGVGSLFSGEVVKGGVAWWAHAGGFATGFSLTVWATNSGWITRR